MEWLPPHKTPSQSNTKLSYLARGKKQQTLDEDHEAEGGKLSRLQNNQLPIGSCTYRSRSTRKKGKNTVNKKGPVFFVIFYISNTITNIYLCLGVCLSVAELKRVLHDAHRTDRDELGIASNEQYLESVPSPVPWQFVESWPR